MSPWDAWLPSTRRLSPFDLSNTDVDVIPLMIAIDLVTPGRDPVGKASGLGRSISTGTIGHAVLISPSEWHHRYPLRVALPTIGVCYRRRAYIGLTC
jgi:hypothetical protein